MLLENILESPLDSKEIKPVNPKGNQPWIFIGRAGAKAETPILWPPDAKNWLIWKDPDGRKDWGHEKKWVTEDEMVGWHHWLNGYEFEQTRGDSEGQGSLACCNHGVSKSWTWLSNWTIKLLEPKNSLSSVQSFSRVWLFAQELAHGLTPTGYCENVKYLMMAWYFVAQELANWPSLYK